MPSRPPLRGVLLVLIAVEFIGLWWLLCALSGHIDAVAYLAAGERLNAGHALYSLAPGDRPVVDQTQFYSAALLYPPLIAVLWRPLAALPAEIGLYLWLAAAAAAMLGSTWYVFRGFRPAAVITVLVCSAGIGSQLSGGNLNAFTIAAALLLWSQSQRRPWVGAVMGLLTVAKLSPGIFLLWLVAQRRWRALAWAGGAMAAGLVVGIAIAGWDAHLQAVDILRAARPQNYTPSAVTGLPWLTPAIDVVGAAAVVLLARHPAASFRAAALTTIFGPPQISLLTAAFGILLVPPPVRMASSEARDAEPLEAGAGTVTVHPSRCEPEPQPGIVVAVQESRGS